MSRRWAPETERVFVACDLPREVARQVTEWQHAELAPLDELRVTGSLHVTLAFLGDLPKERVARVTDALSAVPMEELRAGLTGPIYLPERGLKRIVALLVSDPSGALVRLQSRVATGLAEAGLFKPERRPWLPHLTVARYRRPGQPFPLQNVNIPEFGVGRMVLYSSLLERAGAVHTPLAVFPAS
jgi:2'-5' RNA ligase